MPVGRAVRAGTVGHNEFRSDFSIAFARLQANRHRREVRIEGLHPYLEAKTMVFETMPSHVK